ncbi:RNA polymerase II-associated protein 3 [Halyomorpha halys]|uniref:RNA polymerase II-associated protein 3 n=1 Tax=Halyomorpha halys TaxID=286706 RepID=UPI0006D5197C
MDPCFLQKSVRDNSTELQNFMLDLKNWEDGAKKKEHDVIYGIDKNEKDKEKETVTRNDVEYVKSVFEDGCRQMKTKKWDLAEKSFTNAIRKYSKNPSFFIKRAKCYLKLRKADQAEEDCTTALSIDPKILKAKLQRSQAREMKGHIRGACLDLQDILILDPSNQVAKNALNRLRPLFEESLREGGYPFEEEDISNKTGIGDSIIESLAGNEDHSDGAPFNEEKIQLANAEKEKGNKFVKLEKWKDAMESYSKAIEFNPNDPIFYANRALCYLKTKEEQRAILDCCMALNKNPRYVKVYMRRAAAKKSVGDLWGARYDVKQVLTLEPNNSQAKTDLEELNLLIEKNIPQKRKVMFTPDKKSCPQKGKMENNSTNEKKEFNYVLAVNKPPHLRSKKPLKRIPIKFIDDIPTEVLKKPFMETCLSDNGIQEPPKKVQNQNHNKIEESQKMLLQMDRSFKMEEKKIIEIKDKKGSCQINQSRLTKQDSTSSGTTKEDLTSNRITKEDLTTNGINKSNCSQKDFQYILPIMKKPHLRSKKPLQRIPIKFIV